MTRNLIFPILFFTLLLSACSAAVSNQPGGAAGKERKPSAMSILIIGTLKLDGTAQAVTKEQAADLIPLWQVYKQLMTSDNAAQAEIDGLTGQIKESLTAGQLKAIDDMQLSQSDLMAFMQPQGGSAANRPAQSSGTTTSNNRGNGNGANFGGGMPPDGAMPPGGFPGGDMPGGNSTTRQATGTPAANSSAPRPNVDRVPSVLIDALIQYLQKVAAS